MLPDKKFTINCLISITLYLSAINISQSQQVIQSAVAEGFTDALHSKYLKYIAKRLALDISITTMPFARRYAELKHSRLDIMIGLQHNKTRGNEVIFVYPHYESLSYRFYSLTINKNKYQTHQDLQRKIISTNRHSKYYPKFDNSENIIKFETTSLRQNIDLLIHGRTDLFIHYEESTQPRLVAHGLTNKVSKIDYQPKMEIPHFIAIAKKSFLAKRKSEIEQIITAGIESGDFSKIREKHYSYIQPPDN